MTDLPEPTEENVIEWRIAQRDGYEGIEAGEVAQARQTPDPEELRSVRRKRWGVTQVHRKSCVLLRRYHPKYVWDCTPEKAEAEGMQPCALCLPEHGGRPYVPRPYNMEGP